MLNAHDDLITGGSRLAKSAPPGADSKPGLVVAKIMTAADPDGRVGRLYSEHLETAKKRAAMMDFIRPRQE